MFLISLPEPAAVELEESSFPRLTKYELGRLATASKDCMAHVTTVVNALDGGNVIIPVDHGTRKFANLMTNRQLKDPPEQGLIVGPEIS